MPNQRCGDIAIIGMACRFPGAATLDAFWNNLIGGVESIAVFAEDELIAAGADAELVRHPHYVKAAPVLDDHDGFDAAFFGYSPREARLMDPQQRLFLEIAWAAFEDAGYDPLGDKGMVGVYAGAGGLVSSYLVHHNDPELRGQTGDLGHIANDRDFLPSRVAFKLDLTGPAVNVQTACSTSLVAVHLACRGLLDGEAEVALAGASVVREPHIRGYFAEPGGIYSADGHCRAFDAQGSGTLFGSGVAAVVLKPLQAALAAGDRVYAVIKGSAVTNDGARKVNYTASTVSGQARAMTEAMDRAGVAPDSIGYVECHGTATALGDPLEIQALTRAFRTRTQRAGFCPVGSVKSNFGHLEQCAGLAGLIKTVLALNRGVIPPSLHFATPNPRIPFERSPFFVNTEARPFACGAGLRRAAVNSVGMGGTNAFVVLEQAPPPGKADPAPARILFVLALSAKSEQALDAQAANFRAALTAADAPDLRDLCFTANCGRHHFDRRLLVAGADRGELVGELDRWSQSRRQRQPATKGGPLTFLYSGQGAQYLRMGEALYRAEPCFRAALDRCFALFESDGIALAAILFGDDEARLTRTLYAQPALFSIQVALTELWAAWGITPHTVIGHSVGEFAAAAAAGVCSLEAAAHLVAVRARLMEDLPERGAMASIGAGCERVGALWPEPGEALAIAAENAADRTVVSGSRAALAALAERCGREGVPFSELKTSHAFHSPLMEPMLEAFEAVAARLAYRSPQIRWISTLTGEAVAAAPDARYWRDQIRRPVRFRQAIAAAAGAPEDADGTFLELGPGTTLIALGRRCLGREDGPARQRIWLSSLSGDGDDRRRILDALGTLYAQGRAIRWDAVAAQGGRRIGLPTYPFQHERTGLAPHSADRAAADAAAPRPIRRLHPILGERLGGENLAFEALLDLDRLAFLRDHRVFGRAVLPTAAILDAVIAAGRNLGAEQPAIVDFVYERALTIPPDQPVWTQVSVDSQGGDPQAGQPQAGDASFRLESARVDDDDGWRLHATGTLGTAPEPEPLPPVPSGLTRRGRAIDPARFYRFLAERGLSYGPAFRGIRGLWRDGDQAFAEVALPAGLSGEGYAIHPAFLDACLHVYAALVPEYGLFDDGQPAREGVYVPIAIDAVHLFQPGVERAWVHAMVVGGGGVAGGGGVGGDGEDRLTVDIRAYAPDGEPVVLLRGLTVRRVAGELLAPAEHAASRLLYALDWRETPDPEPAAPLAGHWCIFSDTAGVGEHLAQVLLGQGCTAAVLKPDAKAAERGLDEALQNAAGLVYLRALDALPSGFCGPAPDAPANALVCGECLDVAQALARTPDRDRQREPPRLWLATRDTQGGACGDSAQSPLWGLGRTFALEFPQLWGGLIDLPADAAPAASAALLLRELQARDGEDQISVRAGKRLAPRLVRLDDGGAPQSAGVVADASYWITGGLGRLGLETARALIEAGARHLALTGRTGPAESAAAAVEKLRADAEVLVVPADVSIEAEVAAALARIGTSMPPLKGVVHCAAVFEDALFANITPEQFERVLRPKAYGAWHLHQATLGLDLDFFVLFSSVLSLWGAAGQGAYAAANSYLDALAHLRRAHGLPATVFNWGPWEDAGRWGKVGGALWKQRGTRALPARVGLDILLSHLRGGPVQVAVTDTRWADFAAQFAQTPPLYRELAPSGKPRASGGAPSATLARAEDTIGRHAGQVLGLGGRIDVQRPLNELGLDSLLAVTLANRLRQALGVAVPTAALLKGPSVRDLAAALFPDLARAPQQADLGQACPAAAADSRWLVVPRPNPQARVRLFGFPFAGGGAATFRPWAQHLDRSIEIVAIEPPGRQTRIDDPPIRDIDSFLQQLVPALLPLLDKPFAVYGHCLGALTLFETVRTLIRDHRAAPIHVFVSGARPPDEVQRHQEFETDLIEQLVKLPGYNLFEPIHRQPDEVFTEAIRRFQVVATESLVQDAELRRLILPAIRAEFEMASDYRYVPEAPWDVPITCLTGVRDTYVSAANARSWGRFTKKRFQLFTLDSEHFIVVDDDRFLIRVVNRELADPM